MNPAFAYLYDQAAADPRHERDLALIEAELGRRGIDGRIARESMFRDAQLMVKEFVKLGIKNVVALGNDASLLQIIPLLPNAEITIGYLPLGEAGPLARMLGIPSGVEAVDVLAARSVETMDLGRVNDRPFLTEATLPVTRASVLVEQRYRLRPQDGGAIGIRNLGNITPDDTPSADPKDGWLDLVIQTRPTQNALTRMLLRGRLEETRIPFHRARLEAESDVELFVDGATMVGRAFDFTVQPNGLRLITGRGRKIRADSLAAPRVS